MHHLFKILIVCSSLCIFWCGAPGEAESFLIQEKPERRKAPQQLRQEIAEIMGDILELESEYVATKGQIQQELCKHIRSIAENDKKSLFKTASSRELQHIIKMLRQEKERCEKELVRDKRFLTSLRSNMQC